MDLLTEVASLPERFSVFEFTIFAVEFSDDCIKPVLILLITSLHSAFSHKRVVMTLDEAVCVAITRLVVTGLVLRCEAHKHAIIVARDEVSVVIPR